MCYSTKTQTFSPPKHINRNLLPGSRIPCLTKTSNASSSSPAGPSCGSTHLTSGPQRVTPSGIPERGRNPQGQGGNNHQRLRRRRAARYRRLRRHRRGRSRRRPPHPRNKADNATTALHAEMAAATAGELLPQRRPTTLLLLGIPSLEQQH